MKLQRRWTRVGIWAVMAALVCSGPLLATPVTDGLTLWLDASDTDTLFQDAGLTAPAGIGDPVGGWADKSGNDFHATQMNDPQRPVYGDALMNGQPALRFMAGELDGMLVDDSLQLFRPFTTFIVNQYWGAAEGRTLQGTDGANWLHGLWAGNVSHYADGFVSPNRPAVPNHVYAADAVDDVSSSSFFVNGVAQTANDTFLGEPGGLALTGAGTFGEWSDADISEVIVYDRALNQSELDDVRGYLYDKYSITPRAPKNTVHDGTLTTFTGGDAGEGLDLDGTFQYAVNVGGAGGLAVRDAVFTNDSAPGFTWAAENLAAPWFARPTMGDTVNDDNLETVLHTIRWSAYNGNALDTVQIELDGIVPGADYKLQLLFAERCCDRAYDIVIDGEKVVETMHVPSLTGTPENPLFNSLDTGVVYAREFTADGTSLFIELDGRFAWFPDGNALIEALTLEIDLPLRGDFNSDGTIDLADFDILLAGFGNGNNYTQGDFTLDGIIDFHDFRAFKAAFGQAAGSEAVPEPSTWLLMAIALVSLTVARSKRLRRQLTPE